MMRGGIRLGSIAGIGVYVDWSVLIIFFLVTSTLAAGLFPALHPEWSPAHAWLTALAAAVLFFGSVLVHELSHALVGRARGAVVRRITLFVFGGMAELEREPHGWRAEFLMAIVGPLTSLALGAVFLILASAMAGDITIDPEDPVRAFAQLGTVPTLLLWLGQINVLLAIFNLVPGFPLDGGRVLRALMWGLTGNLRKATRWASGAGQAFAWLLIGLGVAMILGARVPVFGTGLIGGIWLAFIGWFLNNAAVLSYRQVLVREALQGLPVARLMQTESTVVGSDLPVATLVDDYLLRSDQHAFPVIENGRLAGIVTLHDVRRLDRSKWATSRVRDIMTPREKLVTVTPEDDALDVLATLGRGEFNQLPVVEDERPRGLLRREDIVKWLALYGDPVEGTRRAAAG